MHMDMTLFQPLPCSKTMSAVSHNKLCHTTDMPAVLHGRHACCVALQMCGVTQQTCLLCDTAEMSAA